MGNNTNNEDIDLQTNSNTEYNQLNEFHGNDNFEFEADEFAELSNIQQSNTSNDDFLELGSDDSDSNQIDDTLQAMASMEDQKKQIIAKEAEDENYEQMAMNDAEQKEESDF